MAFSSVFVVTNSFRLFRFVPGDNVPQVTQPPSAAGVRVGRAPAGTSAPASTGSTRTRVTMPSPECPAPGVTMLRSRCLRSDPPVIPWRGCGRPSLPKGAASITSPGTPPGADTDRFDVFYYSRPSATGTVTAGWCASPRSRRRRPARSAVDLRQAVVWDSSSPQRHSCEVNCEGVDSRKQLPPARGYPRVGQLSTI
jgi:hypothetical protein